MPTRPIGPGTRNLSINAPAAMAQALGRLATLEGYRSVGELARELFAARLDAARARGLELARDARQMVLPLALCFTLVAGFACTIAAAIVGAADERRPAIVRVARSVRSLTLRNRRREEGA